MKKLKRRLSAAFRPGSNNNVSITSSGGSFYDSDCEARNNIVIGYGMMSAPLHGRTWTLSESMSHLSDKNGTILEECVDPTSLLRVSRGGTAGRRYDTNVNYINGMHVPPPRTHSLYYPRGYNSSRHHSYYGSNACESFGFVANWFPCVAKVHSFSCWTALPKGALRHLVDVVD